MRILFYTGKGGVGKTSVAAASALRCAQRGYRTLVMSTDAAHSLGDSFGVVLEAEPLLIQPNLWAQELNALHELEANWGQMAHYLTELLAWQGAESIAQSELSVIPGTEELFSLLQIKRHFDEQRFGVLVVDAAPTGETLRLLALPNVLRWWITRLFPITRTLLKAVRPVARRLTDMPIAGDEVFVAAQTALDALVAVRDILTDPQVTTARIVMNLEKMVIREAQRSLTYLSLFGYAVDAIVINRILPATADGHFAAWRKMQQGYAPYVNQMFDPLPILRAPHFEREIIGAEALNHLADQLFGANDPAQFLYRGPAQRIEKTGAGYDLLVPIPFASEEQIHLAQHGDELVISVGWHRHRIILPQSLARLRALDAAFDDTLLRITFRKL
ncbi:MAG: ArsA family ATPase [Candidatus Viridilinea halotolerans]|uniref:arsenite-transporting ATPase n=1 Tax=Candidatus Viridilinea halotolerans TaxID=2491704 RepID=A0A426TV94_9CHLR|nr:MAG: ArsA family ATPase [Candidatus Viridilinea halotolerans]